MIAGSLKGRRLQAPPGIRVRPTSDRAREALFDILGQRLHGERFLDLFAGTGAVGIEAHSRGADRAVLVESDRASLEVIDRNLEALGIGREVEVVRAPWPRALAQAAERGGPFTIVFADPPYSQADYAGILASLEVGLDGECDEAAEPRNTSGPGQAGGGDLLVPDPLVVLEHEDRARPPEESGRFRLVRRTVYSRVAFGFYRFRA